MVVYEYQTMVLGDNAIPNDMRLNQLAKDGWEPVYGYTYPAYNNSAGMHYGHMLRREVKG